MISFSLFVHFYLCTRVGVCGNVYPYTVTDDRLGRNMKRKDNGKGSFPRDCIRKFSYHEIFVHLCSKEVSEYRKPSINPHTLQFSHPPLSTPNGNAKLIFSHFTPPPTGIFFFLPFLGAFMGGKEKEGGEGKGDGRHWR